MGESLRESVEAHASAAVRGDDSTFASYMTPQALLQLRGKQPNRPRRYEIVSLDDGPRVATSVVRFSGGANYRLIQQWEQRDGGWTTVDARYVAVGVRLPIWRRWLWRAGLDVGEQGTDV